MEAEVYTLEVYSDIDDMEFSSTPPDMIEEARNVINNLLPQKSKKFYEKLYDKFMTWRVRKNVTSFSENVLIVYFEEMSKTMKSPTLWTNYSVLKTILNVKHRTDISKYKKLYSLLKQKSVGYSGKKAKIFSTDEIKTFIDEAPDNTYLLIKVALIFGVMGACRRHELHDLKFDDVTDLESSLLVTIPNTKTNVSRVFTVTEKYYKICKKYMNLRPEACKSQSFFVNYYCGKCTVQNVGINKFGNMGKHIASYLNLTDPQSYTGHCFRRSSATMLVDTGGYITTLKRHGGWKSTTAAEGYIDESLQNKLKISNTIRNSIKTVDSGSWVPDNLSSEDSSHSELPSGDPLAFVDARSSSLEKGSLSGSSITLDKPVASSSSRNVMPATIKTEELSTIPSTSDHHSSHLTQQSNVGNQRLVVESEISSDLGNTEPKFDDPSLETNQIDANLKRLEDISNKVNQESTTADNFDDFGKYVASLLRCLPSRRAMQLQEEVINLIFRSDMNPSTTQEVLRSSSSSEKESLTRTSSSVNVDSPTASTNSEPSTSRSDTVVMQLPASKGFTTPQYTLLTVQKTSVNQQNDKGHKRPAPRWIASQGTISTTQNVSVHQLSFSHQQNEGRNKRSRSEGEELCELRNKQSKLDDAVLGTSSIDLAIKRLEDISDKVNHLSARSDDNFDIFGTYIASLLKYLPTPKAMGLQHEVINLILSVHTET